MKMLVWAGVYLLAIDTLLVLLNVESLNLHLPLQLEHIYCQYPAYAIFAMVPPSGTFHFDLEVQVS